MEALDFNTLLTIGIYLITGSGLYWKMWSDITKINLKIEDIKCDREKRWNKNDEIVEKLESYLSDISKGVSSVETKISSMETNIEWLKKDNK